MPAVATSSPSAGSPPRTYVRISVGFPKWLATKQHWPPVERHHSSKFYNMVRFYDPAALRSVTCDLGIEIEAKRQRYLDDLSARRPRPPGYGSRKARPARTARQRREAEKRNPK